MFGRGDRAGRSGVHDRDPECGGRRQMNVVDAYTRPGDTAKTTSGPAKGLSQYILGQFHRRSDYDPVGSGERIIEYIIRKPSLCNDFDPILQRKECGSLGGQFVSDQDGGRHGQVEFRPGSVRLPDSRKGVYFAMTATVDKQQLVAEFQRHETDRGSSEIQVAILTKRIEHLTQHLKDHPQDHHSRRGLLMMVGRRNRLLRYLSRTNREAYQAVIQKLGLRK